MKSPLMRTVGMIIWIITALAAINTGLTPFGFNIFAACMRMFPALISPLYYIIGIAGALSLWMFIMVCMGKCACGKNNCQTCGSGSSAGM